MKDERLLKKLADMENEDQIIHSFHVANDFLTPEAWAETKLENPNASGNAVSQEYSCLNGESKAEVDNLLRDLPNEDLAEFATMSETELTHRRGLAWLITVDKWLADKKSSIMYEMYKWQSLREIAPIELERRARQKMLADGGHEPLDQFTSRFLFGALPKPLSLGGKPPQNRNFIIARVKSGKQVAVEKLMFTFPAAYDSWLKSLIKEEGIVDNNHWYYYNAYSAPRFANPLLALFYYKMGFKPAPQVDASYQIKLGWSGSGFRLSHSRRVDTKDLVPID